MMRSIQTKAARRRARGLRPAVDGLEARVLLSGNPPVNPANYTSPLVSTDFKPFTVVHFGDVVTVHVTFPAGSTDDWICMSDTAKMLIDGVIPAVRQGGPPFGNNGIDTFPAPHPYPDTGIMGLTIPGPHTVQFFMFGNGHADRQVTVNGNLAMGPWLVIGEDYHGKSGHFPTALEAVPFSATSVADHVAFVQQPVVPTGTHAIDPVMVVVETADNKPDPKFQGTISIALNSGPAGTKLTGPLTAPVKNGQATFTNLRITGGGIGLTLGATASGASSGTSAPFNVLNPTLSFAFKSFIDRNPVIVGEKMQLIPTGTWDPKGGPVKLFYDGKLEGSVSPPPNGGQNVEITIPSFKTSAGVAQITAVQGKTSVSETVLGEKEGNILFTRGTVSLLGGRIIRGGEPIFSGEIGDSKNTKLNLGSTGEIGILMLHSGYLLLNAANNTAVGPGAIVAQKLAVSLTPLHQLVLINVPNTPGLVQKLDPLNIGPNTHVTLLPSSLGSASLKGFSRAAKGLTINGDLTLDAGVVYVVGDLTVTGNVRGKGSLIATGNITLQGSVQLETDDIYLFVAGGLVRVGPF
jgi:hypothetical protein